MASKRQQKQGTLYSSQNARHGRWGGALKVVRCVRTQPRPILLLLGYGLCPPKDSKITVSMARLQVGGGTNIMGGSMLKDALCDESLPKIAVVSP